MPEVVTFGEAMVSLRSRAALRMGGEVQLSVAGSESNVAIGLARLGHDVAWVGAVGNDEPGRLIQRTLRAENVDTSHLRFSDDSFTGFIAFDQPAHDITRVSYHRRGSAGSTLTPAECLTALTTPSPARDPPLSPVRDPPPPPPVPPPAPAVRDPPLPLVARCLRASSTSPASRRLSPTPPAPRRWPQYRLLLLLGSRFRWM